MDFKIWIWFDNIVKSIESVFGLQFTHDVLLVSCNDVILVTFLKPFPGLLTAQNNKEGPPSQNQTILQLHNRTLSATLASRLIKTQTLYGTSEAQLI